MSTNFVLKIDRWEQEHINLQVASGELILVLGANGSGKSSLIQHLFKQHHDRALRVAAHRQTWMSSSQVAMSAQQRHQEKRHILNHDQRAESRWRDDRATYRALAAVYDLVASLNRRARQIADAHDAGDISGARHAAQTPSPLAVLNNLLRFASIDIEIFVDEKNEIMASKASGAPYSAAQLSDGERNVLLLAADVLTAPAGTLILLDEPERHLHRSITAPLLVGLVEQRPDCCFVVASHELALAEQSRVTKLVLLETCQWNNQAPAWSANVLEGPVNEELRKSLLGGRHRVVFVEGKQNSLDTLLYSLLFPGVAVIPKAGCREVERAVAGLRDVSSLHWVKAYGIVDHDRMTESEANALRAKGVYPLQVFSVESIYYNPSIIELVAKRMSEVDGVDSQRRVKESLRAAVAAVRKEAHRMAARVAERAMREEVLHRTPKKVDFEKAANVGISVDLRALCDAELSNLMAALEREDFKTLVNRYPIRESQAFDKIVKGLGFASRAAYERAVRKLLIDDAAALQVVRGFFGEVLDLVAN